MGVTDLLFFTLFYSCWVVNVQDVSEVNKLDQQLLRYDGTDSF